MIHTIYPWQTKQWQFLMQRIHNAVFPHALLLHGAEGMGQFNFAMTLAEILLCLNPTDKACGQCASCYLMKAKTHADLILIQLEEGKHNIKIDQVRSALEKILQTPQHGKCQVVIIEHAHTMNIAAANALLKSLEEPTGNVFFLLLTDSLFSLPATVKSRCQLVAFDTTDKASIKNWLQAQVKTEINIDAILAACDDVPLKALQFIETNAVAEQQQLLKNLLELCSGIQNPLALAAVYAKEDVAVILTTLLRLTHELFKFKIVQNKNILSGIFQSDLLEKLAQKIVLAQLMQLQDRILYFQSCMNRHLNLNAQLMFENLFISCVSKL